MTNEQPEPVFDVEVIDRLVELFGDLAPAGQLIEIFVGEAPQLVDTVLRGLAADDLEEARRGAHALKSSAASVGAMRLSGLCARLEARLRAGEVDAARGDVGALRGTLQETLDVLAGELARLRSSDRP
ncbi:MAG: Hpt domain-containing protein [Solirubrobacteraceae bacterium]|jgi:HPt (histidine-containing phosphotransfer) domain-containing protein